MFTAVDTHTEGMPTRVITSGVGVLPGATMAERRRYLMNERDDLRTLLMYEPRGHAAMSGAILQPPIRSDADMGVVFIEVSGCLPMCGHGSIGVATALVETGMVEVVEPVTTVRLDTPAGLVELHVSVHDGHATEVELRNVPAFLAIKDAAVTVPTLGQLIVDVAWGGNFYAILPAESVGLTIDPREYSRIIGAGLKIMESVNEQLSFAHPVNEDKYDCHHVIFTGPDNRSAVAIHPGWIDRSPCGTGTSARMAQLHARGELSLHTPFRHSSIIGSTFTGELIEEVDLAGQRAVTPLIRGRAWLTGLSTYLLDPDDPYPAGFLVGAT
jgi:proline racemase